MLIYITINSNLTRFQSRRMLAVYLHFPSRLAWGHAGRPPAHTPRPLGPPASDPAEASCPAQTAANPRSASAWRRSAPSTRTDWRAQLPGPWTPASPSPSASPTARSHSWPWRPRRRPRPPAERSRAAWAARTAASARWLATAACWEWAADARWSLCGAAAGFSCLDAAGVEKRYTVNTFVEL